MKTSNTQTAIGRLCLTTASIIAITSLQATPVIYEPFADGEATLTSNAPGTTSNFANLSLTTINWLDSGSNPFSTTGGSFSLSQSGNDVILNYVIPESNVAALVGGFGMLVLLRRCR